MLTSPIAAALLGHSLEMPTGKARLLLSFTVMLDEIPCLPTRQLPKQTAQMKHQDPDA